MFFTESVLNCTYNDANYVELYRFLV